MTTENPDDPFLNQLYALVDRGFNMIPVYQADDPRVYIDGVPTYKASPNPGDRRVAKTPHTKWKQYKTEHVTKEQVLKWYKRFEDCAWAILGGNVSGDLFIIDFDDPVIFESHFKNWLSRTMVVQTPSGGYHAYFRITPCPDNMNTWKDMYDIDTRGEGGYVLAPGVSRGYQIISKSNKIDTMTDLNTELDVWGKLDIEDEYFDFARIRSEVSVLDMVRHYGDAGHDQPIRDNMQIMCPFHDGETAPSLTVHFHRFKCFGCVESGSALDYVAAHMRTKDLTLAAKAIEKIENKKFRKAPPTPGSAPAVIDATKYPEASELSGDWNRGEMRINIRPEGFISEYMDYAKTLSFAYDEYHYTGALMLLSTITMQRRHVRFAHKKYHPLLYMFLIGPSTVSMKSMAMNLVREVIDDTAWNSGALLPNSFTPEALYELMGKDDQRVLINDEAGAFLKNMKKPYMRDMQDMLCQLFDEKSIRRKLRTSKDGDPNDFIIKNPFLSILFATVPTTVQDTADTSDLDSGWLVRFLFAYPRYEKTIEDDKWFRLEGEEDVQNHDNIVGRLTEIDTWLNNSDDGVIEFDDDAIHRLRNWRSDLDKDIRKRDNDTYGTIMGRLSDYVVKIAMLHAISRMSNTISIDDLDQSIDVIENFFLHTAEDIFKTVDETSEDYTAKRWTSITSYLKKCGGRATQQKMMRKTRFKAKEIAELVDSMMISGEVRSESHENKNGTTTVVYHLQQ